MYIMTTEQIQDLYSKAKTRNNVKLLTWIEINSEIDKLQFIQLMILGAYNESPQREGILNLIENHIKEI